MVTFRLNMFPLPPVIGNIRFLRKALVVEARVGES
jgi:hypothetical protein